MKQPRKVITKGIADSRSPSHFHYSLGIGQTSARIIWDKEEYLQAISKEKEKPPKFRRAIVYRYPELIEIDKQNKKQWLKDYLHNPKVRAHINKYNRERYKRLKSQK